MTPAPVWAVGDRYSVRVGPGEALAILKTPYRGNASPVVVWLPVTYARYSLAGLRPRPREVVWLRRVRP